MADKTDANAATLTDFATKTRDRSGHTAAVLAAVSRVHLGVDMLGVVNTAFVNSAVADQDTLVTALRGGTEALAGDANTASAMAEELADLEEANVSRFKRTESP